MTVRPKFEPNPAAFVNGMVAFTVYYNLSLAIDLNLVFNALAHK